ncbi:hypothetical protein GGF50DRAFT_127568 [Schizophyllum commune]
MKEPPQSDSYTYDATAEGLCAAGTNTRPNLRTGEANDSRDRSPVVLRASKKDVQVEASAPGAPSTPAGKLPRTECETLAQERPPGKDRSIKSDGFRAFCEKVVTKEEIVPKAQAPASVAIPAKQRSKQNKISRQKRSGLPQASQPSSEDAAPSRRQARKAFFTSRSGNQVQSNLSRATLTYNPALPRVIEFVKESASTTVPSV